MLKEFKEFALKGNAVDLAIGVIIGGAFGGIVNSLVNDIFMPVVGKLIGGVDFSNFFVALGAGQYNTLKAEKDAGVPALSYGVFINTVVNFVIIAFILFMVVKSLNAMKRAEAAVPPPEPSEEVKLLREIRDALRRA